MRESTSQLSVCGFLLILRMECYVGDEKVTPQAGIFYGGWITNDVVGPFKGAPGSEFW